MDKSHIKITNVHLLSPAERVIPGAQPPSSLPARSSAFCDIELVFENRTLFEKSVPLFDTLKELTYDIDRLTDGAERDVCVMTEPVFFGKARGLQIDAYLLRPGSFDERLHFQNYLGRWDRNIVLAELRDHEIHFDSMFEKLA